MSFSIWLKPRSCLGSKRNKGRSVNLQGRGRGQLVESFRVNVARRASATLATLGRVDESGGTVDASVVDPAARQGTRGRCLHSVGAFESALALHGVWALNQLWSELGFDALAAVSAVRATRHQSNARCA